MKVIAITDIDCCDPVKCRQVSAAQYDLTMNRPCSICMVTGEGVISSQLLSEREMRKIRMERSSFTKKSENHNVSNWVVHEVSQEQ